MRLASFDLEISKAVEGNDWHAQRPLGISCAAVALSEPGGTSESYDFFLSSDNGPMSQNTAKQIVHALNDYVSSGYLLVTVNGLGFDFLILAEESGLWDQCGRLALHHHCDMMLMSLCRFGWPIGLDALAAGMKITGKLHNVTLKDGTPIEDMSGARAPEMWINGEREAVLAYLKDDVRSTVQIARAALDTYSLHWQSRKGVWYGVPLKTGDNGLAVLPTAAECLSWPRPNNSWMSDPMNPDDLTAWIKGK